MPSEGTEEVLQERMEALKDSVATVAVESWRLFKTLDRLLNALDAKEQQRCQGKIRWFVKKVEESLKAAGLNVVSYEGSMYDPGIPASPINLEDFQKEDQLYVAQMLEPVILDSNGTVLRTGAIALGRVEK